MVHVLAILLDDNYFPLGMENRHVFAMTGVFLCSDPHFCTRLFRLCIYYDEHEGCGTDVLKKILGEYGFEFGLHHQDDRIPHQGDRYGRWFLRHSDAVLDLDRDWDACARQSASELASPCV